MLKINSWEEAFSFNQDLPHGDIISIKNHQIVHIVREQGDFIDLETSELFLSFFDFVLEQQSIRRLTGEIFPKWSELCIQRQCNLAYLGPRWTLPFCYFDKKYSKCFIDTVGLDVGCNIASSSIKKFSDRFIELAKKSSDYFWKYEVFIPHYRYYRELGCNMQGIDIYPTSTNSLEFGYGDLRLLTLGDAIIDFYTVAMIFGPGNPACTYLDVALCLSELKRTCTRQGLIYIADFIVMPSLVLCAISAGFRVFANNSYENGIPIGIFLVRNDANIINSTFRSIIEYLTSYEIMIPDGVQVRILNRELLKRNSAPPTVEFVSNN